MLSKWKNANGCGFRPLPQRKTNKLCSFPPHFSFWLESINPHFSCCGFLESRKDSWMWKSFPFFPPEKHTRFFVFSSSKTMRLSQLGDPHSPPLKQDNGCVFIFEPQPWLHFNSLNAWRKSGGYQSRRHSRVAGNTWDTQTDSCRHNQQRMWRYPMMPSAVSQKGMGMPGGWSSYRLCRCWAANCPRCLG